MLRIAHISLCAILWLLGFLVFLLILAWLTGRVVTDRYAWSQWLWWIPTPAVLVATLIGVIASLRPCGECRRRATRWLAWLIVVMIYFATIEHRMLHTARSHIGGAVRLVHWNITQQPYRPYVGDLMRELIALDGDITVLTNPGYAPWEEPVVDALGAGTPPVGTASMSIMSRFPVSQPQLILSTDAYELLHEARPDSSPSPDSPQQTNLSTMVSIVSVEVDSTAQLGRPLKVYMIDMPSDPRIPRMKLARAIRALLNDSNAAKRFGPPDVIVGDFNIPRGSASVATLFPGMREAFDEAGHGYGASFHRRFPLWHIDHVLMGPNVDCLRYDLVDAHLTRHNAQVAWIVTQ